MMRIDLAPQRVAVTAGMPALVTVTVTNTGSVISSYEITVLGVDASWVEADRTSVQLFPETSDSVTLTITLPAGIPAGTRRITVQVTEQTTPGAVELVDVDIEVAPASSARITLDPMSVTGGRRAVFGSIVRNDGNTPLFLRMQASDTEGAARFEFEPAVVELAPGSEQSVVGSAKARRPWFGNPRVLPFTVTAAGTDPPPQALGTFVQSPRISRGSLSLLGLLLAVSVFAGVITLAVGQVVSRSDADRALLLEVIQGREGGGGGPPGSVAGMVTDLATGAELPGVTVEIYDAADTARPAAAGATADDGRYRLDGLPEGSYKLRVEGAGFEEVWFPSAADPESAAEVAVTGGEVSEGLNVQLGGRPGSVSGTVLGEDPTGAEVRLQLPGLAVEPGPGGAVVATTIADSSGAFAFTGIPSPSTYEIVATKDGFAQESLGLELRAGEERTGVELFLRRGDGAISGTVLAGGVPEGGVSVIATDGTTSSETVSLTQDGVGTFTVRDLPTPGTYTLTFSKEGFTTETLQVSLASAERRADLEVQLQGGAGSIGGRAGVIGSGPAGGITVTVTDGELLRTTTTLSIGDVGAWRVEGLPVPGTYTVTFSRPDLRSQTRQVDLDPFAGRDATGVDANLQRSTATISGSVREVGGGPIGGVLVVLTSGDRTFESATATADGSFVIGGIVPGTYTATLTRPGSQPVSQLLTLSDGEQRDLGVIRIEPRASISGRVVRETGGDAVGGATVRLYRAAEFPGGLMGTTVSASDGSYSFTELDAPRTYIVEVAETTAAPGVHSVTVPLDAGEARTGVILELP